MANRPEAPQPKPTANDTCMFCGLQRGYHRPECPYYSGGVQHHQGAAQWPQYWKTSTSPHC